MNLDLLWRITFQAYELFHHYSEMILTVLPIFLLILCFFAELSFIKNIQIKFNQRFKVIREISNRYRDCNYLQGDQRQENQGESGNFSHFFKSEKVKENRPFWRKSGKNQGISF